MNCGLKAPASNRQRLRAWEGSWMSRTTTVLSPVTVPMTRLSPEGTALEQWTSVAGPGTPDGPADGLADAEDEGLASEVLGLLEAPARGAGDPPQAASSSASATAVVVFGDSTSATIARPARLERRGRQNAAQHAERGAAPPRRPECVPRALSREPARLARERRAVRGPRPQPRHARKSRVGSGLRPRRGGRALLARSEPRRRSRPRRLIARGAPITRAARNPRPR